MKTDEGLRARELLNFGETLVFLLNNLFRENGSIDFRLTDIDAIISRLAKLNDREKDDLCKRIDALTSAECEQLTALVANEESFRAIEKCFAAYKSVIENGYFSNDDISTLQWLFYHLEQLLRFSFRREYKEELWVGVFDYFLGLAEDMDAIKKGYYEMLVTEKVWDDCPIEGYKDTPLAVCYTDSGLVYMRKLMLMERLGRCFRNNGIESVGFDYSVRLDKQVKYFQDLF